MMLTNMFAKWSCRADMRSRTPKAIRLFVPLLVVAMLSLCSTRVLAQTSSGTISQSDNILYAELAKAPAKAIIRRNPLEDDPQAVAAGAKLYGLHCAECHGPTGEGGQGSKKGPSLRADEVQQSAPGTLFWLLTNGVVRRGMPVWSKLPEPQRWQLVCFIKSLRLPEKKPESTCPTLASQQLGIGGQMSPATFQVVFASNWSAKILSLTPHRGSTHIDRRPAGQRTAKSRPPRQDLEEIENGR